MAAQEALRPPPVIRGSRANASDGQRPRERCIQSRYSDQESPQTAAVRCGKNVRTSPQGNTGNLERDAGDEVDRQASQITVRAQAYAGLRTSSVMREAMSILAHSPQSVSLGSSYGNPR